MNDQTDSFRSGMVALVGRPNAGKSTLLNRILGQKVSIVTRKPQTTRHRILGIHSRDDGQIVFLDTPGIHGGERRALNRYMNRTAATALADADLVLMVIEGLRWRDDDERVLEAVAASRRPAALVINKVDLVSPRSRLLPFLEQMAARHPFLFMVPLSATKGENIEALEQELINHLPPGPPLFPVDQVTDRSERFLAAEMIREQLMLRLQQEIPYGVSVAIEEFRRERDRLWLSAVIWIEREAHKPIVIGRGGQALKGVGRAARLALQEELQERVHLDLYVKVRADWPDDERMLTELGYD